MARRLRRRRIRVADVLGVPALPPAAITRLTAGFRAGVAKVHRATAPPPLRILESMFALLDHAALSALCDLDVPDQLHAAMTVGALADRVGADGEHLDRLVRYAAVRGWLRIDRRGRVVATSTTRFLQRDHPGGWRAWVDFMGGAEVVAASQSLATAVRTGSDPFAMANGASFFDWMAAHPRRGEAFDGAMAAGARLHGLALATAVDWSQARTVCDVGGGDGSLLHALVGARPHLAGILVDLPSVVARARPHLLERVVAAPGDAFEAVPGNADTYLLVNVIHDWPDRDVARLLTTIARDSLPTARVIIVEGERRKRPIDDVTQRTDLLMLLLAPGGRERRTDEVAKLAAASGLGLSRVVALASGDVAYVLHHTP